ncbi:MAG TPA: TetR/AcrR family transcriptional regulator C-terminal domain-containing protein [Nocardioidaceae bacterium]|nr:TetR/AcrR family transcriptional regulator C-terminal domain-containing protein [Nocardioidaceae bacterium]
MAVSQESIVDTGLRLLDDHGLAGVSLRRIARELGVQAPTLYWHVANKRQLLDLMAERLITRVRPDGGGPRDGEPWWDWLSQHTHETFGLMTAHRDSHLVIAGNRPTPASLPQIESALEVLVNVGFAPSEAQQLLFALGAYVGGSVLEWHAEADRQRSGVDDTDLLQELLKPGGYPTLRAAFTDLQGQPHGATFAYGLDLILTGARVRHAARVGAPPEVVLRIVEDLHRRVGLAQSPDRV